MRFCALFVIAAACSSDPKLAVAVAHPVGLTVARTTVTVYESDTLRCADIEFGELDDAGLAALQVDTVELETSGDSEGLTNISRTGNKVIVARGFDAANVLISAGCVQKGEVVGDDTVSITTIIAAIVSVRAPTDTMPDTVVSLTDANGVALADERPVSWTVYGPAGSEGANPANLARIGDGVWEPLLPTCSAGGTATIHPNPPSTFGGYAVQVRAAWAVEQPQAYTSLSASSFGKIAFGHTISSTIRRYCAIRMSGAIHHLVCVFDDDVTAYEYAVTITNGKASVTQVATMSATTAPTGSLVIAVLSEPTGTGTDRDVYAVTDHGALVPLFGAAPVTNPSPLPFAVTGNAGDAMYVPACDGVAAKILLTTAGAASTTLKQIAAHGSPAIAVDSPSQLAKIALESAGCVTQLQTSGSPLQVQLATVQASINSLVGDTSVYNCNVQPCTLATDTTLTKGAGVGFTGGNEPRIVLTTLDATGVVLVELVFTSGGGLVERARLPTTTLPDRIIAAQADADTGADLFWSLALSRVSTTSGGTSVFEIAYARKVAGVNLEALSPSLPFTLNDLAAGDLDGDSFDDIVVTAAEGVAIVPNGVTLSGIPANPDATCMP